VKKNKFIISFVGLVVMTTPAFGNQKIKQPNVSGQFYDADPNKLKTHIEHFISDAKVKPYDQHVDIIIAPHAGYAYSGGVAAYSFKAASQNQYKTIIILAPSHYYGFDGISIWEEGGIQTPLGVAEVDQTFAKGLIDKHSNFKFDPKAFDKEHSLEVEIPFLQETFSDFKIVPIILGQTSYELLQDFAKALNDLIADRKDVLLVVSTDLSHYHDDEFARKMDHRTIEAVSQFKDKQIWKECKARSMEMCGCVPVTAALIYANLRGLKNADILRYANSGDISGDKSRVVGYSSIVIYGDDSKTKMSAGQEDSLSLEQKRTLIDIARKTITNYVERGEVTKLPPLDARLNREEGAFVTIHKNGRLRGCIGNIIGRGPLCLTVRNMAISAAVNDSRFKPLDKSELSEIDVEVSVLSKPRRITNVDEIEMGKHGVIISQGAKSGVFLPQVADSTGWGKEEFLNQLCSQKAGLPANCWQDPSTKIEIFTAIVFSENDV